MRSKEEGVSKKDEANNKEMVADDSKKEEPRYAGYTLGVGCVSESTTCAVPFNFVIRVACKVVSWKTKGHGLAA